MKRLAAGTHVAIFPTLLPYNWDLIGCHGTVVHGIKRRLGAEGEWVRVPGHKNMNYSHGCYWFYLDELQVMGEPSVQLEESESFGVSKVIHSNPHTIVFWKDSSTTIVCCSDGESYDEYAGFCAALAKKVYGSTGAARRVLNESRV